MQSISRQARIAGLLYLVLIVLGLFSLIYVPGKIVVDGNPAATAANFAANEMLVRWKIVIEITDITIELFVALALYRLLARVDKGQAQLMVTLGGILPIPIYFVNVLNWVGPLLLTHSAYASAIPATQRDALIMLFVSLHGYGFTASLVFAGLWLLPMGWLVYRSGFLPKFLGMWLIVNGFAWLVQCYVGLLLPQYEDVVNRFAFPFTLGEIAFMLWLVIVGAKEPRTSPQAA